MDITPQDNTATQPISDDQELAKALAGVLPDEPEQPAPETPGMNFEETPAPATQTPAPSQTDDQTPQAPAAPEAGQPLEVPSLPPIPTTDATSADSASSPVAQPTEASTSLDSIKTDALNELRPLIDRVDLPAEEKFDTYLMLIRSTDDSSLIGPAHAAAQAITDEKRKAEALLDVIKEIDYLSRKDQQ
jgi:hypothetical protein